MGKFKDEVNGKILGEFIGLASKLYTYKMFESIKQMKKAKGIKKNIVEKNISFDDYKMCLELEKDKLINQRMIKSRKHNLSTIEQTKKGLSAFDDKRCVIKGSTDTLPWRHFKIGIERNNFIKNLRNLSSRVPLEAKI